MCSELILIKGDKRRNERINEHMYKQMYDNLKPRCRPSVVGPAKTLAKCSSSHKFMGKLFFLNQNLTVFLTYFFYYLNTNRFTIFIYIYIIALLHDFTSHFKEAYLLCHCLMHQAITKITPFDDL